MIKALSAAAVLAAMSGPVSAGVDFDSSNTAASRIVVAEQSPARQVPSPLPAPAESRLDTSGCSSAEQRRMNGPVSVTAFTVPSKGCWNLGSGGFQVEYRWTQSNQTSSKNVGFWTALNGRQQYLKASSYKCVTAQQAGYGANTSGAMPFVCTATASFLFGAFPDLLLYAYSPSGARNAWDIQVAVSLDNGAWDSLNGANYRFRF